MKTPRKGIAFLTISLSLLLQLGCCGGDEEKTSSEDKRKTPDVDMVVHNSCPQHILDAKENNLKISVLLDLSDRIEKRDQKYKDSSYLSSLSKAFLSHVKTKKLIFLEDRLQLFFNPEPDDNKIHEIAGKLDIAFTKATSKNLIGRAQNLYDTLPANLYNLAMADAKTSKGYPGSDIWNFFKYHVKDYCMDGCHRNVLIILTDGYMYYDKSIMKQVNKTSYLTPKLLTQLKLNRPDWKEEMERKNLGFIPATSGLDDLEVLVLGIQSNNDDNPYAQDIIHTYWENWLQEMGVKESNIKLKNADIPSSIEKIIFDFILNK